MFGMMCKKVRRGAKEVFILDSEIWDLGYGMKVCKER